jgi:hypothetical protein
LTLAAAIALLWLVSGWYWSQVGWSSNESAWSLSVETGRIDCESIRGPVEFPSGFDVRAGWSLNEKEWDWWPGFFQGGHVRRVTVPLWPLFLLVIIYSAWLWRLDRTPKAGHCPRCRYDLSATPPSAPCPECGRAQQSPEAPRSPSA